jgi:hypothetical protein
VIGAEDVRRGDRRAATVRIRPNLRRWWKIHTVADDDADGSESFVVQVTAARLEPGATLLVEVARRGWTAAGFNWHGQRLVRPVASRHATRSVVRRIERYSAILSGGTKTEIVIWTDHGVAVCSPSTTLHTLKSQ